MSDPTRSRINAAFEDELAAAPVPPGLRALAVRDAIASPRRRSNQPQLLAMVAAILAVAIVATLVLGSHLLRPNAIPARPTGSATPPVARLGAAVAFDQAHGDMVLFGGQGDNGTGMRSDTWTFDGSLWTEQHPAVHPQARTLFAMAYDAAHHGVVVFGGMAQVSSGKGGLQGVDDTWTWNGSQWRELHPAHAPAFGYDWGAPTMQFDPISHTVLIYGYTRATSEANTGIRAETWSWDGTDWKQLSPASGPVGIGTMLPAGDHVLLVAGSPGMVGGAYVEQTWAWDGSTWNLLAPRVNLPSAGNISAAYDPQRRQLLALVGAPADTWTWDGSTWTRVHPPTQPPTAGYMTYLPALHEIVSWADIFSAFDYGMFSWNGSDWRQISPARVLPPGSAGKGGYQGVMTPDQAAAAVRSTVKNTQPVLLPAYLPAYGFDATVTASPDDFSILYRSDQRDKQITFGIMVANPPPGSPSSSSTMVRFRNSLAQKYGTPGYATYFVYDPSSPTSQRWLMWSEPGTMANPQLKDGGVPYFLATSGLTDQEFWQVANSLR